MAKIGRNAPCHCGSGKKYKKCCLFKDEERAQAAKPQAKAENEEDALFRDEAPGGSSAMEHGEPRDVAGEEADLEGWDVAEWSEFADHHPEAPRDSLPKISDEDEAVLDDLLEECAEIDDVDGLKARLDLFIADRPDLVIHLLDYFDPLIDLGHMCAKAERLDDYANLILRLRRDFKDGYQRVFGMLDQDVVAMLAASGRYSEIDDFLDLFQKYPSVEPERLFAVLDLLLALNLWSPALDLAQSVYLEMTLNPRLINCEDIQLPVIMNCYASALDAMRQGARPESAAESVVECLRGLRLPISPKWCKPDSHVQRLQLILGQDRAWNLEGCATRSEVLRRYAVMLDQFMRFLHDKAHLHWVVARQYCHWVENFFSKLVPEGRIPRQSFPLTLENTKEAALRSCGSVFSMNLPRLFGLLNSLHLLADFLVQTGSVSPDRGAEIQGWVGDIYNEYYQEVKDAELSIRAFERFPLFSE